MSLQGTAHEDRIPLTVLGGYLGAGKTTMLNHLLRHTGGKRFAILVNDFGSINIDASLLESKNDTVLRLDNGCVCCTLQGGLGATLQTLLQEDPLPEHVLVEASGVADPVRLGQYAYLPPFRLDGVVVVADAETVREKSRDRYVGQVVLRALGNADVVVLNKLDLLDQESVEAVRAWMSENVPGVRCLEATMGQVPASLLVGIATERARPVEAAPHPEFASWAQSYARPLNQAVFREQVAGWPDTVIRAKGFLHLSEDTRRRHLFQLVGKRWSLTPDREWLGDSPHSEIILIGLDGQLDGKDLLDRLEGAMP